MLLADVKLCCVWIHSELHVVSEMANYIIFSYHFVSFLSTTQNFYSYHIGSVSQVRDRTRKCHITSSKHSAIRERQNAAPLHTEHVTSSECCVPVNGLHGRRHPNAVRSKNIAAKRCTVAHKAHNVFLLDVVSINHFRVGYRNLHNLQKSRDTLTDPITLTEECNLIN